MSSQDDLYWQQLQEASDAVFAGKYSEAIAVFERLMALGYAPAAISLADMYLAGQGVVKNPDEAIRLMDLAVEWGDSRAAFNLGAVYRSGSSGVPQDIERSKKYFLTAKKLGCAIAVDKYL